MSERWKEFRLRQDYSSRKSLRVEDDWKERRKETSFTIIVIIIIIIMMMIIIITIKNLTNYNKFHM